MMCVSLESAGVSQKTINALMKGLQLRAKDRYQSMRELKEALCGAEETWTENRVSGNGTQQPQAGEETLEKRIVTDGNTGGLSERSTVSHNIKTDGHCENQAGFIYLR